MSPALCWIVSGFILMIAELFVPAFLMLFLGFAGVVTGILLLAGSPETGGLPCFVFSIVALLTLALFRKPLRERLGVRGGTVDVGGEDEDFLGRHAVVLNGFDVATPSRGLAQFRGSQWSAESSGGPFAHEQRVLIAGRAGALLIVEATEN